MRNMGTIIDHFQVPHPAPEQVEQASATFEQLADEYREAQRLYYGRVTSRLDDIREANAAAAAARIKGTKFDGKTEAKIDADLAKAKTEMETLAEAVDMAGDTLAQAVVYHRDAWRKTFDDADQEADPARGRLAPRRCAWPRPTCAPPARRASG